MVAERRDLMVATYSLLCGTGARVTVAVWTGMACIPAPAATGAGFFWHPVAERPIRIRELTARLCFKALFLTRSFLFPGLFGPRLGFVPD
jgi:hypothetical protein